MMRPSKLLVQVTARRLLEQRTHGPDDVSQLLWVVRELLVNLDLEEDRGRDEFFRHKATQDELMQARAQIDMLRPAVSVSEGTA